MLGSGDAAGVQGRTWPPLARARASTPWSNSSMLGSRTMVDVGVLSGDSLGREQSVLIEKEPILTGTYISTSC